MKSLSKKLLSFLLAVCVLCGAFSVCAFAEDSASSVTVNITGTELYSEAFKVLDLVNSRRASAGLAPLTMDEGLMSTAMMRAAETSIYFSHTRPDGEDCFSVYPDVFGACGENIAAGLDTASATMDGWMNSSGHRANILSTSYTRIGVGCFVQNGVYYWVQCFGGDGSTGDAVKISDRSVTWTLPVSPSLLTADSLNVYTDETGGATQFYITAVNAGFGYAECLLDPDNFTFSAHGGGSINSDGSYKGGRSGKVLISMKNAPYSRMLCDMASHGMETMTPASPDDRFFDVPSDMYYYNPVNWAVSRGITNGMDDFHFGPDLGATRANMITFLWRCEGSPKPKTNNNPFRDVYSGTYYHDAVLWAVENGITKGTTATTFSPDDTVTRAQVVTFLWRYAGSPKPETNANPFRDVYSDIYYHDAVLWGVEKGITNGMSQTTFEPDSVCVRAQVVTFLYRFNSAT